MAWVILGIAGILEIAFAFGMKWSDGFTRLIPALLTVATGLSSVFLLSLSLRTLPVGTGYAVWTGIGAAGTAIMGIAVLGRFSRTDEDTLHSSHFGRRYRTQVGFGKLKMSGNGGRHVHYNVKTVYRFHVPARQSLFVYLPISLSTTWS